MPTLIEFLKQSDEGTLGSIAGKIESIRNGITSDATPTSLNANGTSPGTFKLVTDGMYHIELYVTGYVTTGSGAGTPGEGIAYYRQYRVTIQGGAIAKLVPMLPAIVDNVDTSAANWAVDLIDNSPYLDVQVTGDTGMEVLWTAFIDSRACRLI